MRVTESLPSVFTAMADASGGSRRHRNAIRVPSGENRGHSSSPGSLVIGTARVNSAPRSPPDE
jgi:hypothetical protein